MTDKGAKDQGAKSSGSNTRLMILLGVLVVVAAFFGYDYFIAKASLNRAMRTIDILIAEQMKPVEDGQRVMKTVEEVHEALGRQPSDVNKAEHYLIEKYSWRAGKLYDTYDLYVQYRIRNGEPRLWTYRDLKPFEEKELPKGPIHVANGGEDEQPGDDPPEGEPREQE